MSVSHLGDHNVVANCIVLIACASWHQVYFECVYSVLLFFLYFMTIVFIITMHTTKSKIIANKYYFWYTCITCYGTMLTYFYVVSFFKKVERIYNLISCLCIPKPIFWLIHFDRVQWTWLRLVLLMINCCSMYIK